eukprot:TRINITY_DN10698_c0_g1_i3.p1 TRINITY_DN10698_c0_g1~~TRINITY_DN10698_c0_g1_i3.p1  ORF type:complete len:123 (-),score=4.95 TRINITY_DN10698_c0_g1_i3:406-774(-)
MQKGVSIVSGTGCSHVVLNKVRDALTKRGTSTVRGLSLCFRCLDSYDGNRKVDKEEFRVGMSELGLTLSKAEADVNGCSHVGAHGPPRYCQGWNDKLCCIPGGSQGNFDRYSRESLMIEDKK